MLKYIYIVVFGVIVLSCEKEIEYKGEYANPILVVDGLLQNDSVIKIGLQHSVSIIGDKDYSSTQIKTKATLVLTDKTTGEIFNSNTVNNDGFYEFGTVAKLSHNYSLSVTHPDYKTCSANTSVPAAVTISSWDTLRVENKSANMNNQKQMKITLKWNDPAGKNFYILKVLEEGTGQNSYTNVMYFTENESTSLQDEQISSLYLTDELFDNQSKTISIFCTPFNYMNQSALMHFQVRVSLYSVTEETYKYYKSTSKVLESDGFLTEPVKVFTNLSEGLGLFGGMNRTEVILH